MLLAALATILGAMLQSATGFGFALILGPVLFGILEPEEAVATLLILGSALNLLVLFGERRPLQIRRQELRLLLLAALPGLVLGTLILRALSKPPLQVVVGGAVLSAASLQARRSTPRAGGASARPSPVAAAAVGLLTGVLTTTTATSGPPLLLWFQRIGSTPGELRDSLAAAFLALNVLGAGALALFVGDESVDPPRIALLLALTLAGHLVGRRIFLALDAERFRAIGLAVVVAAGAGSIVAGVLG